MNETAHYADMKDSGIRWIGNIPSTWGISRIGSLYSLRNEKVSDRDYLPLSVTMKGIVPQLATVAKSDDNDNRKLVRKGDFVINSRSDRRGSCGISPLDGSVSLINTVLTPLGKMHPGYYDWLFHTTLFADEFYQWGHGIVDDLWTTRWQEMKQILVPVPPLGEQDAISAFLDAQCSRIDTIIQETKVGIEDYKKWKRSLIFHAVTKGINSFAEMKCSKIKFIGNIPKHWKTASLKKVAFIQTGSTPPKYEGNNNFSDVGLPWIKPDDLGSEESIEKTSECISETGVKFARIFKPNTVYVCCIGTIGKSGYSNMSCSCNQQINNLLFSDLMYWKFGYYSITSQEAQHWYYSNGNVIKILNASNMGLIKLTLPPMQEQLEIVNYLDQKCGKVNSLIQEKQDLIADLEHYKRSLIYETVTGKRKVV